MAKSIFIFSIAVAACALAQEHSKIDVKLGLWETTTAVKASGLGAMIDTSKMTPEMREKMESAVKMSQAKMGQPHTTKSCLTQEKIEKDTMFNPDQMQPGCKRTIVANDRSTLEVKFECANEKYPMTGVLHIDRISRESIKGTIKMSGGPMTSDGTINGKWISDSCGDVK